MISKKHVLSALCIVTFMVMGIASGDADSDTKKDTASEVSQETQVEKEEPKPNWTYEEKADKMSGTKQYYAITQSTNKVDFKFPYNGGSTFHLVVRHLGENNELYFLVSKGQFMSSYNGSEKCRFKFDDDQPMTVSYGLPADGSSNMIFPEKSAVLIKKLKTAKKVMVEAPFYEAGRQVAEFDVEGLVWDR